MKRFINLLVVAAFVVAVPLAMAQTDTGKAPAGSPDKPAKLINCCVKGKCEQVKSEADCAKAGGKVVKDCKECK